MDKNNLKLLAVGLAAGILSGLLGIGGGIILVPAMVILLKISQHEAQGTSLFVIIWTSLIGSFCYHLAGNLNLNYAIWLVIGSLSGAYLGSGLALKLSGQKLRLIYIIFLILVGLKMIVG